MADETSMTCTRTLRALEVAEELVAESMPRMRAFDESRHVGDDEAPVAAQADDAEVGRQSRERIVGDLRARGGDARDERRLAGVRKADETHVGEELQPEVQPFDLARLARLVAARRAVGGAGEGRVAAAAASALRDEHALIRLGRDRRA